MSEIKRWALMGVVVAWVGCSGGVAVASPGGQESALFRDGGGAARGVVAQASAQELAAWEAERVARFEASVREAAVEAERAVRVARTASAPVSAPASASASGVQGGGGSSDVDWGARIKEALDTPAPRPVTDAEVDPAHQQAVEDSMTTPLKEFP